MIYRDENWMDMVVIIIKQFFTAWNHFPLEFAVGQVNLTLMLGNGLAGFPLVSVLSPRLYGLTNFIC